MTETITKDSPAVLGKTSILVLDVVTGEETAYDLMAEKPPELIMNVASDPTSLAASIDADFIFPMTYELDAPET